MKNKILLSLCFFLYLFANSQTPIGLPILGSAAGDESGNCVRLSANGKTLAVGEHNYDVPGNNNAGRARVFILDNMDNWVQIGANITGVAGGDNLGTSVALSSNGRILAVGSPGYDDIDYGVGLVTIYEWDSISVGWVQKGSSILGTQGGEGAGHAIKMSEDGSKIIISGRGGFFDNLAKIRVFEWDNGMTDWIQKGSEFTMPQRALLGNAVSMSSDGNIIAFGAPWQLEIGVNRGLVKVYNWNVDSLDWVQMGETFYGAADDNEMGWDVSLSADGKTVVVASAKDDATYVDGGLVQVYNWNSLTSAWVQKGGDIRENAENAYFGSSVDISAGGDTLAVGLLDDIYRGSFKVFVYKNNTWVQQGATIKGKAKNDFFSTSLSLSSHEGYLAVGAIWNDDNGENAGSTTVYNLCGSYVVDTHTACGSYSWIDGHTYTSNNNTATKMYTNVAGCDSMVVLDLKLLNDHVVHPVYSCGSYTWIDGNIYTSNNSVATFTLTNSHGCDSILTLNLIIDPTLNSLEKAISPVISKSCDTSFTTISVNNSQTNVNYYLYNNETNSLIDGPLTGNAKNISFPVDTSYQNISYRVDAKMEANSYITGFDTAIYLVNSPQTLITDSSDYTIEAYFRVNPENVKQGDYYTLLGLGWWDSSLGCGITFTSSEDGILDELNSLAPATPNNLNFTLANLADNKWHYIAQTFRDSIHSFYLDGVLLDSVVTNRNLIMGDTVFNLVEAYGYSWARFKGDIDEVRIWKTGKTTQEINYLMHHSPDPSVEANLVAYWDFSDGSGNVIYDRTQNQKDLVYAGSWATGGYMDGECQSSLSTITTVSLTATTHSTDSVRACNSFAWIDGNTYTTSNNTASYTLTNVSGCDSIVTLHLTIDTLIAYYTQENDPSGQYALIIKNKSKGNNMTYNWDFGDGSSSTNVAPDHTYSSSGTYSICLSVTGLPNCTDQYCDQITLSGKTNGSLSIHVVNETVKTSIADVVKSDAPSISIYPNPNEGSFMIDVTGNGHCTIVSSIGQVIYSNKITEGKHQLNLNEYNAGMYFVLFEYEGKIKSQRLVITR